ncbi:MAG: sensor histidine kinase, partial [bacterium]
MKTIVKVFVGTIFLLAVITGIYLYYNYYESITITHFLFFSIVLFFTNNGIQTSSTSREIKISMMLPISFLIMYAYGPFWTAIILAVGGIYLNVPKNNYIYKFTFNRSMFVLTGAASSLMFQYIYENVYNDIFISFAAASLVYYVVNNGLVLIVVRLDTGKHNVTESLFILNVLANLVVSYFIGILLWYTYQYSNLVVVILLVIFVYIIRHFIYANLHKYKIQHDLKKSNKELEYIKLKNIFFRNLSHEFKTPLNLIFSSVQLMEMQTGNMELEHKEKMERYLAIVKQNSFRLLRLVNNLIDLTKFDSESYKLNKQNIDIVTLGRKVTYSVEEYILSKNKKLEFDANTESIITACDPIQIERVLLNLLSNAVKFTDEGDIISVSIKKLDGTVRIIVQ